MTAPRHYLQFKDFSREEYEYLLRLQTEAEKVFLKEGGEDGI